jgi:aromatic ring-opening dioxygenase LigB subunit
MFEAFTETRRGMQRLAEVMKRKNPDVIVIATPHNLRLDAAIGVITTEFTEGKLEANKNTITLHCKCDRELAGQILKRARKLGLPVVGVNFGASGGEASCMPMDWGALIPLWFVLKKASKKPDIVMVTPSREIPLQNLIQFGSEIAKAAESSGKAVAFIASADQGHAHDAKGPYGFHKASAKYDALVKKAIEKNDLAPLMKLSAKFVEDAKPDSLWQMAMLQGVLEQVGMVGRLLSYQVPTYFGLLCAVYLPEEKNKKKKVSQKRPK